jgi:hypothetical protein
LINAMKWPTKLPVPAKIVDQVLEPIGRGPARVGNNPDVEEVDAHIRLVMQTALDWLARKLRFPVLG